MTELVDIVNRSFAANYDEFNQLRKKFKLGKRDPIYEVATFIVKQTLDERLKELKVADGLAVLLLIWNSAVYRHGSFDFDKLDRCIEKNYDLIISFRNRTIFSLEGSDEQRIIQLFDDFNKALESIQKPKSKKTPVGVAKALHLLAPRFFPLWDETVANKYGCNYSKDPAKKYFQFCKISLECAKRLKNWCGGLEQNNILKQIDEYNYSKYTIPRREKRRAKQRAKRRTKP